MNNVTKEILKKIQDKKTLDIISKEMNIRESTLKARIDSLIHQEFLAEITYGSGCKLCPMKCSSDSCNSEIKMFSLTKRGKDLLSMDIKSTFFTGEMRFKSLPLHSLYQLLKLVNYNHDMNRRRSKKIKEELKEIIHKEGYQQKNGK